MNDGPRVSFGVIVLNGEPFTRYCLRSLYPFAHEIIVVEGGHEDTRAVATPDGHSIDGTLETLNSFIAEEDPENKVRLVTRDGFWPKRDQFGRNRTAQSQAYAELATGDYLWQVDIDEFYRPEDMRAVLDLLDSGSGPTHISFKPLNFFGDIGYLMDGWEWMGRGFGVRRVFEWGAGYRYVTHEPPTVQDAAGRDVASFRPCSAEALAQQGIYLYHYCQLFPWQVRQKALVYRDEQPEELRDSVKWAEDSYFRLKRPFHVERHYREASWLRRFSGAHPPEVLKMMHDIRSGGLPVELRQTQDIERLLNRWWYPIGARALRAAAPIAHVWMRKVQWRLDKWRRALKTG